MNKIIKFVGSILTVIILFGFFVVPAPVSAYTCNSATLTGNVITGTPPTHARFAYSTNYNTLINGGGTITPVQYFNTEGTFPIQQYISGLTESTTYYYRLEVTNNYGSQTLNIENFTTPACPIVNNPVNGGWSDWSTKDNSCGISGVQTRTCTNPTPANGGAYCSGASTQTYTNPSCPVTTQIPTVTLIPDDLYINYGESTHIRWETTNNPTYCYASGSGWSGSKSVSGGNSSTGTLYSSKTYNIVCSNSAGSSSDSKTITVGNPPVTSNPIVNLTADTLSVPYGGSTIVRWTSTNAVSCTANSGSTGWTGSKPVSGNFSTGTLTNDTMYNIVCYGGSGSVPASGSLMINVGTQPITVNPTGNISANSCSIGVNASTCNSSVYWNTYNLKQGAYTAVTKTNPSSTVSTSTSGNMIVSVNFGTSNFYLYHDSMLLDQSSVTASCTSGTSWNGNICVAPVVILTCQDPNATNYGGSLPCIYSPIIYPVNGGWSAWSDWTTKSNQCGYSGVQTRTRECNNPVPANGGAYCSGSSTETQTYTNAQCPVASLPTMTLVANPSNIQYGGSSILTWSSTNATSCSGSTINNSATSGTMAVYPVVTTTYSMTCTGPGGSVNSSATVYVGTQIQNPTVNLTANPTSVAYGGSSYVSWTSQNATSCNASGGTNGWSGSKENSSTFYTGNLYNTTTYNINCYNSTGQSSDSITIYVNNNNNNNYNQAPVINLYASPTYVTSGGVSTINWNPTNNPTYCTASNGTNYWAGSRSIYGSSFSTGALYSTTVYTMTCTNNAGSSTESVTVNVANQIPTYYQQPSVSITSDRMNINSGENTIVRWYPTNATTCTASGGSNGWAGSKSIYAGNFLTGALYSSTTYTISCSNYNGGYDTKSVTVIVGNQLLNNQPTVNITTDQTSVAYNGATFVRWYTTNATSCYANGGSIGWAGTKSIGPGSFYTGSLTSNKTYSITCTNNFGSASDSTNVNVREQIKTTPTIKPAPTSLVLITSSVDRNQPIVPTIDNTRPKAGDEINYTVNYQNIGTGAITNLTLQMILPQEVNYMFSNPSNPTISGNVLIFNLGTLKANGQGTVTVRVKVRENIPAGTNLNFPATLSYIDPSGMPQSVNANVSAQVWSEPVPVPVPTINDKTTTTTDLGALAFIFGNSFLPNSLLGWLLLILLIVLLILAARKAYYGKQPAVIVSDTHK